MSEFIDSFDNQGQENQNFESREVVDAESEEKNEEESQEKTPIKASPYAHANVRSNQLVNNKYKFSRITLDNNDIYFIQAKSVNFDRILRRTPREVNRFADDFIVPLGMTCLETIICAYGLSYGIIYSDETWLNLINKFNRKQTLEDAQNIIRFLRAAATIKYLVMSGEPLDVRNKIAFTTKIQKVATYSIVDNFCSMVK